MTQINPLVVETLAHETIHLDGDGNFRRHASTLTDDWLYGVLTANYQTLWAVLDDEEPGFELS